MKEKPTLAAHIAMKFQANLSAAKGDIITAAMRWYRADHTYEGSRELLEACKRYAEFEREREKWK